MKNKEVLLKNIHLSEISCAVLDKRIAELEKQNTELQENNTELVLENRELKKLLTDANEQIKKLKSAVNNMAFIERK